MNRTLVCVLSCVPKKGPKKGTPETSLPYGVPI